ncbi:MAG: magnesium/cobalt transporter CorA [Candidatus Altiarchaeales archaeon]|nr:magnesium/cobalt transporter CorA [Candidatus Altiarchaeales archaeon]MBD3417042.1 magnesium/cobalt transporter CorA [Candidatus Altiarchaeales archaeon]
MSKSPGRSKKAGLPPGSPVHVGESKPGKVKITVFDYNETHLKEEVASKVEECAPFKKGNTVTWINIDGIHDVKSIEAMGVEFGLHPLLVEDIVNTDQRPKIEDHGDYLFIVCKMLHPEPKNGRFLWEQVSIIFGSSYVLSFQEHEGDVFDPIRNRLREGKPMSRKSGADYLAYSLLDAIVDNYFILLEELGERIDNLEAKVVSDPTPKALREIQKLKKEMIFLRRSVWPMRDVISGLDRSESNLIHKPTKVYLRDVYDHTIQVIDTIETYRDILSVTMDIYLSSISNRMNEVMKVLTIIATIFIPLTFITGWYGMNFRHMPELESPLGYPIVLAMSLVVAVSMYLYFYKKKWL